jgi:hypothetical protein
MDIEKTIAEKPAAEKLPNQKVATTDKVYEKLLELQEQLTRIEARMNEPLNR